MRKIDDIRFTANLQMSIQEYNEAPGYHNGRIHEDLRMLLADKISSERQNITAHTHHVEHTMELYVATPEEFWKIINDKAIEIARSMSRL